MEDMIVRLPAVECRNVNYIRENIIYSCRITCGKKKFMCTLNIKNPPSRQINMTVLAKDEPLYIISGGAYRISKGVSRAGLPKLTAEYVDRSVNAEFLIYKVPAEPELRWATIDKELENIGIGCIVDPSGETTSRYVGAVPFGTQMKLINPDKKLLKVLTIKPGGAYEEK